MLPRETGGREEDRIVRDAGSPMGDGPLSSCPKTPRGNRDDLTADGSVIDQFWTMTNQKKTDSWTAVLTDGPRSRRSKNFAGARSRSASWRTRSTPWRSAMAGTSEANQRGPTHPPRGCQPSVWTTVFGGRPGSLQDAVRIVHGPPVGNREPGRDRCQIVHRT